MKTKTYPLTLVEEIHERLNLLREYYIRQSEASLVLPVETEEIPVETEEIPVETEELPLELETFTAEMENPVLGGGEIPADAEEGGAQ